MKSNTQTQLSSRLYLGDVDGDKIDEIIQVEGRHLYVFKPVVDFVPVLTHVFPFPVLYLVVGDFTNQGREHGRDQICAVLSDGSLQAFAISDDLKSLWWWFTQPNFIKAGEHAIVGDFDGDGADDVLVYKPASGEIRLYSRMATGFFAPMANFALGNLSGANLVNKQILAGDFGQAAGRKDLLVIDYAAGQIMRYDSATEANGTRTFWWAFTSNAHLFQAKDQVCVANISGATRDEVLIRNFNTGQFGLFKAEFAAGALKPVTTTDVGQLPIKPRSGKIIAAKVRDKSFRKETGGLRRDDVLFFEESTGEFIRTDARFDGAHSRLTYWWAFSSNLLFEPSVATQSLPWAVILCRFKGAASNPAIETFFRQIFTPGAGGMVEYWHDVSLNAVDISKSRLFGWVELDIKRIDAGGRPRSELIDAAIAAAKRDGLDPETGFHSQIAVFTHNWAKDGAPAGSNWSDPVWGRYWIDGSADGRGKVSAPPHGHSGSFIAHEMGHGFGFKHDLYPDLASAYGDPNCIMSALNVFSFTHPVWGGPFGPAMSFPQLVLHNWMYPRRIHRENKSWLSKSGGVSFLLASISDPTANADLGAILPKDATATWSYYLEYMRPNGWNQGIGNDKLVVRRVLSDTAVYLGEITLPSALGTKAEWTEPSGKVKFQVEKMQADGRVIKVTAVKNK